VLQPDGDPADEGPAHEDLTARARIRDAALRLFAERGIDGASIRDIAKAAGVSGGLVRHHFGSKEGLRNACDTYALDRLVRIKEQAVLGGQLANPGFLPATHPTILLLYRYLARAMVDGSRAAAAMFDDMVELTEQWLAKHRPGHSQDPRAYAAVLVTMQTGLLALHEHLSRALDADILGPAGHLRMSRALVDFYSFPLLGPELAAQAHAAFDQVERLRGTRATTRNSPRPRGAQGAEE
jgi:TetR/AcrR family transcriptional regulator, regulator of cefoperazone and chloramphenicol sensitivity